MDFHFGGQYTSLTEDEAGGFGLWTRRLDLHSCTQPSCLSNPASPTCDFSPTSPFPLLLQLLQFCQSNIPATKQFSSSCKAGYQPPPSPVSLKPPSQGDSFLMRTCDDSKSVSKSASEGTVQTVSQLCFSHGSGTSQQICARFGLGFSPSWRQQGYPGNRLLLLHSPLLRACG